MSLKSMADHIRFKDPEKHRAKILEFLDDRVEIRRKKYMTISLTKV
jgi:hypothetical protein